MKLVEKYLKNKEIQKTIYIKNKIINFIVNNEKYFYNYIFCT